MTDKSIVKIPTGALHKALQDAFQAGGIEAVRTLQEPGKFLSGKHKYCDDAVSALQAKEAGE